MRTARELMRLIDCLLWGAGVVFAIFYVFAIFDVIDFHICIADPGECQK